MVVHPFDLSTQEARTVISRLACASKTLPQKCKQKTRTPTATTATYWTVLDVEQAEKP